MYNILIHCLLLCYILDTDVLEKPATYRRENFIFIIICFITPTESGPGSSLGIVNDYGLDDPGLNPGGDEIFRPSRPALEPTQPPVKWIPGHSRG